MTKQAILANPTTNPIEFLKYGIKRLLQPNVTDDIQDKRRLSLLMPLTLGMIALVMIGIYFITETELMTYMWMIIITLVCAFGLAHTKYYTASLILVVFSVASAPYAGVYIQQNFSQADFASSFTFILPSLIMGQIFFSFRELIIFVLVILGAIIMMTFIVADLTLGNTVGAMGIIIPASTLLLIAIWYRDNLEKERLSQLELLIDRSNELANEAIQASRLKSELLAKVSHELRTPLGAILGSTQLLESGTFGALNERQTALSTRTIKRTRELTNLVEALLDQAQIEKGQFTIHKTNFDPKQLIENCDEMMRRQAEAKGIKFITILDSNMPNQISNDLNRLTQIANNLLGNAIKYTQYGTITLKIERKNPDTWTLEVSDTGSGIPEEAQKTIFEPFRQGDFSIRREKSGVGLGLAIVQQLVAHMGGTIDLESRPKHGSQFTITLPFEVLGSN